MRLLNLMHECIYSLLKRPAVQRASKVITSHSYTAYVPSSVLCCEKSRCHVCRGFVCFWFLLLADANNADRTLCKYL